MKITSEKLFVRQVEVGKLAVFSYVVADRESREGLIIDPGGSPGKILNVVDEDGIKIRYIVNTHSHNDHIAFNAETLSKTGAQLIIHELEAKSLTRIYKGIFNRMLGGRPSPEPDVLVKDGDSIRIGGSSLEVIHTPGHSKGGICLYSDDNLFTGDTLFVGGIGRTDLPGGSLKVLLHSIEKRLLALPDETIVWPGHNYGTTPYSTVMHERFYNPFLLS
ncbi:MAG: MBL fold metallo-hydrolase [Thermodesulfobacteriota bacterium]|nr:MBL fold metallo-hydrolase [Thermodesulfobacteriota bacterium]